MAQHCLTANVTVGGDQPGRPGERSAARALACRDLYSVVWHPDDNHVMTGGHDREVRLYDVSSCLRPLRTLHGHDAAVTQITTNAAGNLVVSGSRDGTVRFWDVLSGICVKSFGQGERSLGEITSVALGGTFMLSSSRHGPVRLWDLRSDQRPLLRFSGHQNTSASFIRAGFAAGNAVVFSGSEDGFVHLWDAQTGALHGKLAGHQGAVNRAVWCDDQGLLASCSEDGNVATWWWKDEQSE